MSENKTSHLAHEYDGKIDKTIPRYSFFHDETIDLIETVNAQPITWLDTGCGTGRLIEKAIKAFKHTGFVLADPSEPMLTLAKGKFSEEEGLRLKYLGAATQDIDYPQDSFDVITAIQSHHYMDFATRKKATANCFRMLKPGGIYVTFENIKPNTGKGAQIGLQRWKDFQLRQGKNTEEVSKHIARFDVEFFPISIVSHLDLLHEAGFSTVEILWASTMQAGFYAIK